MFTTNHIEKLDPALLRSGRMDMHINMSYCSFPAFKILLKNYMGYKEADLELKELEGVIDEAEMTPADISEVLIKNQRDKSKAVQELLQAMKIRAEKTRAKKLLESNRNDIRDKEQEKMTLDIPKEGFDQLVESCNKDDEKIR